MNKARWSSVVMLVMLALTPPIFSASQNPFPVPERGAASFSEGPFAVALNPVFADQRSAPVAAYQYSFYDGRRAGNHFMQSGFFGFSYVSGWFQDVYLPGIKHLDRTAAYYGKASKGFLIKDIFGIGASYSFSVSNARTFKGYQGFTWGLLFRPWRYISLGFVMDDAWGVINAKKIAWREIYSLSIRPGTERVTLSLDVIRARGQGFRQLDFKVHADVRIWYDISLFASFDRRYNLLFGVSIPIQFKSFYFTGLDLHYYRSMNSEPAPGASTFGIAIPLARNNSALWVPGRNTFLKITIDGAIKEIEKRSFFGMETAVFYDLLRAVRTAGTDPAVDGIFLEIRKVGLGFGQLQELRGELKEARLHGKKVYAVMTEPGNKEYYLASVADRVYFTPNSPFYVTGLVAQVYFFKGLMDKIGVEFESLRHGAYKSFNESFTREHMSDEFRENMSALISDLNEQYIADIMADRGVARAAIDELFGTGSLTPDEAVQKRFIDRVGYYDEAVDEISPGAEFVGVTRYMAEKRLDHSWGIAPVIAVVFIDGSIVGGESFETGWFRSIGDATYQDVLGKVFSNPSVKAVVIRINSGGGSASASDYMLNALVKMKKKYNTPVVFSYGNVAASGGYYVACTGDRIFSDRGTVTGSIGVVFGKISLMELYKKIGITKDVIKMSEYADIFSESRRLTDGEKKLLQEGVDFTYRQFTGRVIAARKIKPEEISGLAEGRVFTGRQALGNRLVDEMGGLITAIEYARRIAHIDREFEVARYPDERGPIFDFFKLPEFKMLSEQIGGIMENIGHIRLKDEKALYLFPYRVDVR